MAKTEFWKNLMPVILLTVLKIIAELANMLMGIKILKVLLSYPSFRHVNYNYLVFVEDYKPVIYENEEDGLTVATISGINKDTASNSPPSAVPRSLSLLAEPHM